MGGLWDDRVQALEASVAEAAGEVAAFYGLPADPPTPAPDATILVVQADGKGVPMVQPSPAAPSVRLSKGQKRGKKKAAVVTGLYSIAPYRRTPQAIVAALLHDPDGPEVSARPAPIEKELHATLEGKTLALHHLVERVARREGPQIQHRVALSDGAEALQQQLVTHLPQHTLVLDIIHATAYLWDTANALLGETHPHRTLWVRHYLEPSWPGGQMPSSPLWKRRLTIPYGQRPNGKPSGARSAITGATARICGTMRTWQRAGRLGQGSSRAPVGIW
jgi:hypothetical protein